VDASAAKRRDRVSEHGIYAILPTRAHPYRLTTSVASCAWRNVSREARLVQAVAIAADGVPATSEEGRRCLRTHARARIREVAADGRRFAWRRSMSDRRAMRPARGVRPKNAPQACPAAEALIRQGHSQHTYAQPIGRRVPEYPSRSGDRQAIAGGAFFRASGRGATGR
jgi:hypothetical protein